MKLPSASLGSSITRANELATVVDDATLVRRCLRDDSAAIQALIDRFQGDVLGLCLRLLHHRHDAEDVCQEVFIRIFRSMRRWDPKRPLKPWVMSIAFNRCKTWLGQRARRPELVDYLHETAASPAHEEPSELAGEIQIALQTLRVEYRTVIALSRARARLRRYCDGREKARRHGQDVVAPGSSRDARISAAPGDDFRGRS